MIEPKLRFKKDNGNSFPDLEKRKLGESIRFINGRAYKQDELLKSGKYLVLRVGNLFTNDSYYYSDLELDDDKYIEDGNLIYAWSATFGPRIYHGKKCIYHYHIWKLEFDENIISKMFLNYYLLYDVEKIKSQRTGGTMVHITKNAMEHRELYFPSLPEQQKIADFLSTVDTVISNYNDTIKAWEERKKGVMQKLFGQEVRFKADDGSDFPEWEEKTLSEIASIHARIGWQNLRKDEFLTDGNYLLITGTDFCNGRVNFSTCYYVDKERYEQDKNIQVENGTILVTKDGTLGKVALVENLNKPATLNAGVFAIKVIHADTISKFLYHWLAAPMLLEYASKKSTGGTIKHLNQGILVDFPVGVPCIAEQRKIADCLSSLDEVIEKQKATLAAWEELKKGLLQQMFV